jgi:two-component system, OmpR family, response regulator ResD
MLTAPSRTIRGPMTTILVVDDEPKITRLVRDYLESAGFAVISAGDGPEAVMRARTERPDLVVLDLGLPRLDGLDVTRRLRQDGDVPIIMLTARDDETDKLIGLELGADDYVTKPFSPRELAVRVRAVLRRSATAARRDERLVFGELEIDAGTREVTKRGEELRLTAREFDLLYFLASNRRRVFSREHLMERVWGYSSALDTGTVTVHIRRLREKIEDDPSLPRFLETVWGVGYRFAG